MKKSSYLVLGSSGFIGTNLVKKLLEKNVEVVTFSRKPSPYQKKVKHIIGDFEDVSVVKKALRCKPDVIYCLVGLSGQVNSLKHQTLSYKINVAAHINFFNLVIKNHPRTHIIFSSSRLEYGKPRYLPVDEQHPIQPLSLYGLHKHFISDYCQFLFNTYGLPTTVFRTSNPYGPHMETGNGLYNLVNFFIDQSLKNHEIKLFGTGKQQRDYLYIDDLIEVLMAVGQNKKSFGKIYNIGSGKGIALKQVVEEIISQTKKGIIMTIPWPKIYKDVETGDYVSDISFIYQDMKWRPIISLKDGLRKTITYQKSL